MREARVEPRDASDVIDRWRELHAEPMEWVLQSVKNRLADGDPAVKLAHRLKRKPQIVSKLTRSTTRLSQMQDIAGCRVLLEAPSDVESAHGRITRRSRPHYDVYDQDDYRVEGRHDTGYRALHLKLLREERSVEVQLRTKLQHAWAEAVERAGERTGFALKSGEGPDEIIDFFRLASDAFALVDGGTRVPPALRAELRRGYATVRSFLPPDPGSVRPAQIERLAWHSVSNNWLIIYNWREAKFENWLDLGTDAESAARRYGEYERRYPFENGYEVVLIGADSSETIRYTHAHYFGRTPNDLDPHGFFKLIL